jgi:hypothetical protein
MLPRRPALLIVIGIFTVAAGALISTQVSEALVGEVQTSAGTPSSAHLRSGAPAASSTSGGTGPATPTSAGATSDAPASAGARPGATEPSPDVSENWLSQVQADIAEREYAVSWQARPLLSEMPASWQAPNRAHSFRTYFTEPGIRVFPRTEAEPSWEWSLRLSGYGRGGTVWPVETVEPSADGKRVDYGRAGVEEWYENSPRGLKQGFVLTAPPEDVASWSGTEPLAGQRTAPGRGRDIDLQELVHLDLTLGGSLRPVIATDGQAIDFATGAGANVVHYAELVVTDANDHEVPAWMEDYSGAGGGGIRLVLDARKAVFPITIDPLATSTSWMADSNQANANFGASASTAGDVNSDGYADVIVGAKGYDNGETDEGRAYLYLGSGAGLSTSPDWAAESNQATAFFGESVATAGDVNGDGYADVIVGAESYDNGEVNEGRAYLYLGSGAGLSTSPDWTAESNQASAFFGTSVSTAGDVNGDGYTDVIVGARLHDNGEANEGRAYLYLGSGAGLSTSPDWTAEGNQGTALFGDSVATAGDVNGDAYADVIIGAYGYDNGESGEGRAYVYHGSAAGLEATAAWTAEGEQADANFGRSVSTAGDINGDGYADVIVGAPSYDNGEADEGQVYLYLGSGAGLSTSPGWINENNHGTAYFGDSVATAGDVNGDGYADVIIGAYGYDNGESSEGRAYLYLGSGDGLSTSPDWTAESNQVTAYFGRSVSTAGDVNGDGYTDVIVGALYYDNGEANEGAAFLYHGSSSGPAAIAGWTAESDQASAYLGYAVATAGDVNGDGYADVLVGVPLFDEEAADEGKAFVYHGSASGLATIPARALPDSGQCSAQELWGRSVATAGDVNGDGFADVIIGSSSGGRVYLYRGSASGLPDYYSWAVSGSGGFGRSVASAGDINGDGFADVIIGANLYDNGETDEGGAHLYLGSASGLSPTPSWSAEGDQADAQFGTSVAAAGDVNGDGWADVIVGAPGHDNGETDEGGAFVYLGSTLGLSATPVWTAEGEQVGVEFGASVATAGDVNGDSYADVIIGAPDYFNGVERGGSAFVYLGSPVGLSTISSWRADCDESWARFGHSVSTAGDVNGDGYADVIVGAQYYGDPEVAEGGAWVYLGSGAGLSGGSSFVTQLDADWGAEGDQADAEFGFSVAKAGDVNGDGYSEVIVGAYSFDNVAVAGGMAFLYYGNENAGLSLRPQQRRLDDAAPIAPQGRSDSTGGFRLAGLGRTPYGRGRVKLEWEVKPLGILFDGTGTQQSASWFDTNTPGVALNEPITGLTALTPYHWRARLLYDPATTPFQQASRWFTVPWTGWEEIDLRTTGEADLAVTMTDSPDPITYDQTVTYTLTVTNDGPDPSPVDVRVITCHLDSLGSGAEATVTIVVTSRCLGLCTNQVEVAGPAEDPDLGDNSASEDTTTLNPVIGDRVWEDLDGDGIQDAGEPGVVSALVYLFDPNGVFLDVTFTDSSGNYGFSVPLGSYYVRFIPPPGYVLSPQDQGSDDGLDSDADPTTGNTPVIGPLSGLDKFRWDVGVVPSVPCVPPDEPVYIFNVRLSTDGNEYPILDFVDANQPDHVTGYNVYRSDDAGVDPLLWPLVADDVVDMYEGVDELQWVDSSGDAPPGGGIWFYDVAAYNHRCPAEGPR